MKANSKEVSSSQFDRLENRMNHPYTDDNSVTEILSGEIPVDHYGLYDPSDNLATLHWLASFIEQPSLGDVSNPPVSPPFAKETKDLQCVEQICNAFRRSSSISAMPNGSCSANIPTCIPDVTASRKKKSIRAAVPFSNWGTSSLSLVNPNPVMPNCPNISVSCNDVISDVSDLMSSEKAKSQSSNKICETNKKIEEEEHMKCMYCGTQKTPQWRTGPIDYKILCNACGLRYRFGKLVPGSRRQSRTFAADRKCTHCGTQKTQQWRRGPMGRRTLCNPCGLRYKQGTLPAEYKPKLVNCTNCGAKKLTHRRCDACGLRYRSGIVIPENKPSSSSTFPVSKPSSEEKVEKESASKASEAKQASSGFEVMENCLNSSLLADTPGCRGSDYFVSKQTKSDSINKEFASKASKDSKDLTSNASQEKQTGSGFEVMENYPNSPLLADTQECIGSDYSVSMGSKSDSIERVMRKEQDAMNARKCIDCGNHRTMDSVTPCNTCGVRYSSARNSEEYSPIASPKFSADKVFYSDMLVLERKAQKELVYQGNQTHAASQLQDSSAEPPQNGLENQQPQNELAELQKCSSLIHESSLVKVPKPLVSPRFGAETKDLYGVEQTCNKFEDSCSNSALERSSCSRNVPTCDVTASRKKRCIKARVPFSNRGTRSSPLDNPKPVVANCPKASVPDYSELVSYEQEKPQSSKKMPGTDRKSEEKPQFSNKMSETDMKSESKPQCSSKKFETDCKTEAKEVIKCMYCGIQSRQLRTAGPIDFKTLCKSCRLRYKHGKLVSGYRPRLSANPTLLVDKMHVGKRMHCGSQKTPQLGSGPMGSSTLCNACEVSNKHGELLTEYRPPASTKF